MRAATTDHGGVEVGGGVVVRAANVTAGAVGAEVVTEAGAGGCRRWVVVGVAKTAEVAGARGCCAAGEIEVVRSTVAGGCWTAGATKVARLAVAGGCWAAGRLGGGRREPSWPPNRDVNVACAVAMSATVAR